jgi:hypothetical protein
MGGIQLFRAGVKRAVWLGGVLCACSSVSVLLAQTPAQRPEPLNESGQIVVTGRSASYLIRHLPVSSFPGLPEGLTGELNRRGCLIPQSYEAHHPENVVHASLERAGSFDWAVLCSSRGTVSLLVYFSSAPTEVLVLAAAPETERLQAHDSTGVLGFNWGIDPVTPQQIRQAQSGMAPRPAPVDHDALADTVVDRHTVYHFYLKSAWTVLEMP